MKRVYVVDDLLLFNPDIGEDKEIYHYNDLKKNRNYKWSPIVEFVTADINSVFFIADKMLEVFGLFGSLAVILRDDSKKRMVLVSKWVGKTIWPVNQPPLRPCCYGNSQSLSL